MRSAVARLAGPVLLIGSMVAVWLAAGLGGLSSPQTKQAATSSDVVVAAPVHPSSGTVLRLQRDGDRLLLVLRSGSSSAELEVTPGAATVGTSLATLTPGTRVLVGYALDGAVSSITVP